MTVAEQARVFAAMALCGALCGAEYDVLGLVRRALRLRAVGTGALDLLFGVCCALVMIAVGLQLQAEVFRLYAFFGLALGLALYAALPGRLLRLAGGQIRRHVKKSRILDKKSRSDAGK